MATSRTKVKYLPADSGRSFAHLGTAISFKDEPADNGDALFLFEMRMPPGNGVPQHKERNHEAFYVLDGTLEIEADGENYCLGPSDFLSIRPGVLHALRNPGPAWVRALTWVSPGSQHVRFFERLGEPIDDPRNPPQPSGPPDFAELLAVARECGMEFEAPQSRGSKPTFRGCDPDSVVVTYVMTPSDRHRPAHQGLYHAERHRYRQGRSIAGAHEFWVEMKDTDGRSPGRAFAFQVIK